MSLKSAYERAMERVERLGKASAEELKQMREKEYAPLGEAAAERYLKGQQGLRELGEALGRQREGSDIVRRAVLARLLEAMTLEDYQRPLEAVAFLAQDKSPAQNAAAKLRAVSQGYKEAVQESYQRQQAALERNLRQELVGMGISGSAIEVDARATAQWDQLSQEIRAPFQSELAKIKQRLLDMAV